MEIWNLEHISFLDLLGIASAPEFAFGFSTSIPRPVLRLGGDERLCGRRLSAQGVGGSGGFEEIIASKRGK